MQLWNYIIQLVHVTYVTRHCKIKCYRFFFHRISVFIKILYWTKQTLHYYSSNNGCREIWNIIPFLQFSHLCEAEVSPSMHNFMEIPLIIFFELWLSFLFFFSISSCDSSKKFGHPLMWLRSAYIFRENASFNHSWLIFFKKNPFLDMDKLLLFFQATYDWIWSRKEGYA